MNSCSRRSDVKRLAVIAMAVAQASRKACTVLVLLIGLLPIMWSSGTGADMMRRIATPMVGGIVTAFVLELTVYPSIFAVWKMRRLSHAAALDATAP
jgi:Cu(I)/Ag(I) efflux system membrane protein CusA/SilA